MARSASSSGSSDAEEVTSAAERSHGHRKAHKADKAHSHRRRKRDDAAGHGDRKRKARKGEEEVDTTLQRDDLLGDKIKMFERERAMLVVDPRASRPMDEGGGRSHFFDLKGDRDNVAFGCQYVSHVPAYTALVPQLGVDRVPTRYYSKAFARAVANGPAGARRVQSRLSSGSGADAGAAFIALVHEQVDPADDGHGLRGSDFERARELNVATRERPSDVQAWVALAESRDDGAQGRMSALAAASRKTEVLRRAVETNPTSEALTLAHLASLDDHLEPDDVAAAWRAVLRSAGDEGGGGESDLGGSVALWSAYLTHGMRRFATFTVGEHRDRCAAACRALRKQIDDARVAAPSPRQSGESGRIGGGASKSSVASKLSVGRLELAYLLLVARVAYAEVGAGYTERGVGLLIALLEYNLFRGHEASGEGQFT